MRNPFDWKLIAPVGVLLFISLVGLFSIDQRAFWNQLTFTVIGSVVCAVVAGLHVSRFSGLALPLYLLGVIILGILLFIGIESRGAVRWVYIFGISVQFSEVLKPLFAISLASYLAQRQEKTLGTLIWVTLLTFPVAFAIIRQPDLGSALVYVFVVIMTLFIAGYAKRWFMAGVALFAALTPVIWQFLHDYQRERIITFLDPSHDPLGISYNAIQSMISVGSGGLFGRGLGQGPQSMLQFLPERHTDFIFATLSEELGFVGSMIIVGACCMILWRLAVLIKRQTDSFFRFLLTVTWGMFFVQITMNIGMNIGLLPVVGVTLPFVSYGGSSLLTSFVFLGIALAVSRRTIKGTLEIT
jgi:rod shape determining protein RodA